MSLAACIVQDPVTGVVWIVTDEGKWHTVDQLVRVATSIAAKHQGDDAQFCTDYAEWLKGTERLIQLESAATK